MVIEPPVAVRLLAGHASDFDLTEVYRRAIECDGDAVPALGLALELASSAPHPGSGKTAALWEILATLAAADPTVARIVEPHLDAIAILAEAPEGLDLTRIGGDATSTWGVFAAEGPGTKLVADTHDGEWLLSGTKPWCSLGGMLSHALVTAHLPTGARRLFATALGADGVAVSPGVWAARGLVGVPSGPIEFDGAIAIPVGAESWYLDRPGFAWGGMGVAAIWWGAAIGVARAVKRQALSREPDQVALMHLGAIDVAIWSAGCALRDAASRIDETQLDRAEAALLANQTRTIVADAADAVIRRTGRALGPGPLALDARHAGRVADLELYLRQHHAERDEASIGRAVMGGLSAW